MRAGDICAPTPVTMHCRERPRRLEGSLGNCVKHSAGVSDRLSGQAGVKDLPRRAGCSRPLAEQPTGALIVSPSSKSICVLGALPHAVVVPVNLQNGAAGREQVSVLHYFRPRKEHWPKRPQGMSYHVFDLGLGSWAEDRI